MELTNEQIYEIYTACIGGNVSMKTMKKEVCKFLKKEGLTYDELKEEINIFFED